MANKVGRPTKYRKALCQSVIDYMSTGKSLTAWCVEVGIHKETAYAWAREKPEFSDALKTAKRSAQKWWEDLMQQTATGEMKGSLGAQIFWMKNRFRDEWQDRVEQDIQVSNVEPVVIKAGGETITLAIEERTNTDEEDDE